MLATSTGIAFAIMGLALLLNLWRLLKGPDVADRIVALDTLYVNTIALIVLLGIFLDSQTYFESALLIAMMGFIGTVTLCKYLMRGSVIE